ncbi:Benzoate--CoA ligase [Oligella urethralis]|uniref:acyl-CoA synthetase n=1 Tax=Oligella TaxID=90243 RepID=UPI000381C1FA|nr:MULTISPECIES: acyl-CoA synthetase [Oligella]OFV48683.1 AMP-dependent synthetase [Oligella sp. HMSC09E12]SUA64647.1 Benzoate--CoA ligase [Oligella urethralis]SUA94346.1 Benzoate--CoA ligase [Oligella urethralis]
MSRFSWQIPEYYNIAVDTCDKWADGSGRLALIEEVAGETKHYSFDQLRDFSNQFANALKAAGVKKGDRVGILLTQGLATGIAHLATYKLGAIAVPLFALFGLDALSFRIAHAGITTLITDQGGLDKINTIRSEIPCLKNIFNINQEYSDEKALSFWSELNAQPLTFEVANTLAEDPAIIIFTSGTTGKPKGACHAHRVLLGHLPGVETSHNNEMDSDDTIFWTPADWAWIGGLLDLLLPAWHHGRPVVASRASKFNAEDAFSLMNKHQITHTFLPPTALKMLRFLEKPQQRWSQLKLRSIASGGETLGKELLDWGRDNLNLIINEFYGQTECNMIVSSCAKKFAPKSGSMGKAVPGHHVTIINSAGEPVAAGEEGDIAVLKPDPVMFLYYWNDPEATKQKFNGEYLLTGDRGVMDEDSYFFFIGRDDDVITSAGYRIGPGPIEDGLLSHPAISMAAVIGIPDPDRTEIVTAFVVLKEGYVASEQLKKDLQDHVRTRVAAHEYPRQIHFLDELPMTTTGKIIRKELRNLKA